MKFIVNSTVLQKQLSALSGVIINNPVVPILENFLFVIEKGKLTASASDLQITMTTELNIETNDSGSIAVPAKILLETLKTLPEQPITFNIDTDSQSIELTSYKGRYKLTGERAEDFPKIPEPNGNIKINTTSELLAEAISNTLFAVGNDELRPAMTGVYLKLDKEKATFVATDGNRLIRYERQDITADQATSMILPKKAMSLLKSSLPGEGCEVDMQFSSSNAFFGFNNVRLSCRLIDENYPDYENAIPLNNENVMVIDRSEMLSSLKRLDIYSNKTTHQIRLKLQSNTLQIFAEDLDFSNEGQEQLMCEFAGDDMEIGFNAKFLIEILSNSESKEIEMKFSTPNRAGIILPKEKSPEEEILMLIMPVMLNSYA
jgi:DNA polymerase III subunit beta